MQIKILSLTFDNKKRIKCKRITIPEQRLPKAKKTTMIFHYKHPILCRNWSQKRTHLRLRIFPLTLIKFRINRSIFCLNENIWIATSNSCWDKEKDFSKKRWESMNLTKYFIKKKPELVKYKLKAWGN